MTTDVSLQIGQDGCNFSRDPPRDDRERSSNENSQERKQRGKDRPIAVSFDMPSTSRRFPAFAMAASKRLACVVAAYAFLKAATAALGRGESAEPSRWSSSLSVGSAVVSPEALVMSSVDRSRQWRHRVSNPVLRGGSIGATDSKVGERPGHSGGMSTVGTVVLADELNMPPLAPGGPPFRKWAYAFLMAGCDPDDAQATYLGFLYNVLGAAYVLKEMPGEGDAEPTKADVVVMVQMSHRTNATELPAEHEAWLQQMGVKVQYLPRPATPETFQSMQMCKFHVLNMTQYSRVMFLDGDVMPLTSLDYVFDMSEPLDGDDGEPLLSPNLVHTAYSSPSNGGLFMLEPKPGHFDELQAIIKAQQANGTFDPVLGWGHAFHSHRGHRDDDHWHNVDDEPKYLWDFHAADVDQGLLYHWTKYVRRDVSVLNAKTGVVEHFKRDDSSPATVKLVKEDRPFEDRGLETSVMDSSVLEDTPFPARNFYHATGNAKPWMETERHKRPIFLPQEFEDINSRYVAWFGILWMVAEKLEMDLDVVNLRL